MSAECQKCKKSFPDDELIPVPGQNIRVCPTCAGTFFVRCPECLTLCSMEDLFSAGRSNKKVCIWCISEKYLLCPVCRNFFSQEEMVEYHNYHICRSCRMCIVKNCDFCGNSFPPEKLFKLPDSRKQACAHCFDRFCKVCDDCGAVRTRLVTVKDGNVKKNLCSKCADARRLKPRKKQHKCIAKQRCTTPATYSYTAPLPELEISPPPPDAPAFDEDFITRKMLAAYGLMSMLDKTDSGLTGSFRDSGSTFCTECEDYCEDDECERY